METIKFWLLLVFALIGEGFRRLAVKLGLEEKWDDFSYWLKDDPAHSKMFASCTMIAISMLILLCFYGCDKRVDL